MTGSSTIPLFLKCYNRRGCGYAGVRGGITAASARDRAELARDILIIDAGSTAALQSSLQKILISDASKFGKITSCFFAGLEEFDTVITDASISASSLEWMRRKSIRVEVV